MHSFNFRLARAAAYAGLIAAATALAGCSSELASFDDTYVPASVEENFPIEVVERPLRLSVQAGKTGLPNDAVSEVAAFGREAAAKASTPVTLHYSSTSKTGREAANQAAAILKRQGVPAHSVILRPDGKGHKLVLAFSVKAAETKPCGAWPENLRSNQFNESGTAFGCAVQQNIAAMVANPGDFEQARSMPSSQSAPQSAALKRYGDGAWTAPTADSDF